MTDVKCDIKKCLSNSGGVCASPWIDLKDGKCQEVNIPCDAVVSREEAISKCIDRLLSLRDHVRDEALVADIMNLCYNLDNLINGVDDIVQTKYDQLKDDLEEMNENGQLDFMR